MTADQKSKVAELKAEIAATATGAGTPLKVRTATVALKQELRRYGVTARAVASALGVSPPGSEGPTISRIAGIQGPTRWRGDGSSRSLPRLEGARGQRARQRRRSGVPGSLR
jgi:hypothetical protein